MADIPAIETRYGGHRFRSRLEARWAVFFTDIKFEYEYELEGYKLPSGACYLPDFYLPKFDAWVEVKPHKRIPIQDLKKVVEFALEGEKNLLLIIGTPSNQTMLMLNRRTCDFVQEYGDGSLDDEDLVENYLSDIGDAEVFFTGDPLRRGWTLAFREQPPWFGCMLGNALLKAKQARFEHGENG